MQETVNKLSHLVASSSNFKDDINILPPRVRACVRACVCMEKEREREAYSNVFDDLIVWTVNSMDRSGLAVRR